MRVSYVCKSLSLPPPPLPQFVFLSPSSADWHQCTLDAAERVDEQSEFDLVEMNPRNLPNDSDFSESSDSTDSDYDSGAGGGPVPGFQTGGSSEDEEEAGGFEDFYYGGGGRAIVRATSGGERVKTDHAGEKVKLTTVVPYRHRDGGSPGTYMIV